jgi:hypothetical protein
MARALEVEWVMKELDRILRTDEFTSVLGVLGAIATPSLREVKVAYKKIARRIHPDRGVDPDRALRAMAVLSRAFELAKSDADYEAFHMDNDVNAQASPDHVVPMTLMFDLLPSWEEMEMHKAREELDEAENVRHDAAAAAAHKARAAAYEAAWAPAAWVPGGETEGGAGEGGAGGGGAGGAGGAGGMDGDAGGGAFDDGVDSDDDDGGDEGFANTAAVFIPAPPLPPDQEEADEPYPDFAGVEGTPEHSEYLQERKKVHRQRQRRRSNRKAKRAAKEAVQAEAFAAMTWRPLPLVEVVHPVVGLVFSFRWQCEQHARGVAAVLGLQNGVTVVKTHEKLESKCRSPDCRAGESYSLQPKTGNWRLTKVVDHKPTCFGAPTPADGAAADDKVRACKSPYLARQAMAAVLEAAAEDPNLSTQRIRSVIMSKGLLLRAPSSRFFGSVQKCLKVSKGASRAVDMATLEPYVKLLKAVGHTVIT